MAANKPLAKKLFAPECGGTYEVWETRPFSPVLVEYGTDCYVFLQLYKTYAAAAKLTEKGIAAALARQLAAAELPPVEKAQKDIAAHRAIDPQLLEAVRLASQTRKNVFGASSPCAHFKAGKCGYGATCKFSHAAVPRQ